MAITERWVHKLDGVELNDATLFVCEVPDAEADFGADVLLTNMQARTPVFNRQQPAPGRFTFLITVLDTDADRLTSIAALRTLVAPGPHVYTRARPLEDAAGHTITVYFDGGLVVDSETGLCTAKAVAPDPTWT